MTIENIREHYRINKSLNEYSRKEQLLWAALSIYDLMTPRDELDELLIEIGELDPTKDNVKKRKEAIRIMKLVNTTKAELDPYINKIIQMQETT